MKLHKNNIIELLSAKLSVTVNASKMQWHIIVLTLLLVPLVYCNESAGKDVESTMSCLVTIAKSESFKSI